MRAVIDYDAARDRYIFYVGGDSYAIRYRPQDDITQVSLTSGDERPPFIELSREEYEVISEEILLRETPRYADPALLREMLDDTRTLRDRVLAMLERNV